jgi:2-polyprenyl-6-methoxyphenol hydroxylase-like FAD-dependent oxidoreductase
MSENDVLIAGAGPAGLSAALALASAGIRVSVFEAEKELLVDPRGSTFHPPTLDMLDAYGVGDVLVRSGVVCPQWQVRWHPSGERAVFDLSVLKNDTGHPYRLQVDQAVLSHALLDRLVRMPEAKVEFGAAVTAVAQDSCGASLALQRDAREETVTGSWIIGADGSHSAVRRSLGLELEGSTYPETTLIVSVRFPFEDHLEGLSGVNYCWREGGNFSLMKVQDHWRVSLYPLEGKTIEEQLTPDSIEAALQHIVPQPRRYEVLAQRAYRAHQRMVSRWRAGRIFLAGDAAHLTSPTGGMGLNGGVHDALNLAQKLIAVIKRGEPDSLLDLYERQRRPVVQEAIIAQSHANRARMRELDAEKRRESLRGLQEICADRDKLYRHMLDTSMITGLRQAAQVTT